MTNWIADRRLLGARSVAMISATKAAVSCRDAQRIVVIEKTSAHGWQITGDTGDIGSEPGKVIYFNSHLWTVTRDGRVKAFSL